MLNISIILLYVYTKTSNITEHNMLNMVEIILVVLPIFFFFFF